MAQEKKQEVNVNIGDVFRMNEWGAFPDVVVLGFENIGGTPSARVTRPYVYAHVIGCISTPLYGSENYTLPIAHLQQYYRKLDSGRTI